ncbi:MAG: histone deacetylase family protein [Desulfobacterales bacterium]|nr:histone deacetylase family protein [Desulfobacterales bacterium]
MITIYSEDHRLHHGQYELIAGGFVPPFENPTRLDIIISRLKEKNFGEIKPPNEYGLDPILRVHTEDFINFLRTAYDEWYELHGGEKDAMPITWPTRHLRQVVPKGINGKLGYYSFDAATPITSTTWQAITSAVNVALTGVDLIKEGQRAVFSLCRPPGHHAAKDLYAGYCFFNNAAIATQAFIDKGAERVAILDIDYHHGNGTQAIFYDRSDVLFVSLHGDPDQEYPYFLGYKEEIGTGKGEGFNKNFPMPWGTLWPVYKDALDQGIDSIQNFKPDALVVSTGVDTFEKDPISKFKLKSENYLEMGNMIESLSLPTLFVMEGGYAVDEIGINTVNLLSGFEEA